MYAHLAFLLVAATRLLSGPFQYPTDVTTWIEVPIPKRGSADYLRLCRAAIASRYEWIVVTDGKRVMAKRTYSYFSGPKPGFALDVVGTVFTKYRHYPKCATRVEDGWLVAYNAGEFGGAIWWFSGDGKRRYEVLDFCNVNQFISTKDGLFAIEGCSHGWGGEGSILRLVTKDGKWVTEVFAKLATEGRGATVAADGTLVVITSTDLQYTSDQKPIINNNGQFELSTKLVRVTKDGKVETIFDSPDWLLSANSLQISPSGTIYIGMRHFVAAYNPADKAPALKFLVPNKDFLLVK
jgi:hypothetical protein